MSQTAGVAKGDFDDDMFWLDETTVPTIGDYLVKAGYNTFWKGKWHASQADVLIPDTHDSFLSYNSVNGVPEEQKEKIYLNANRLNEYGFDYWIGPEPFGSQPHNSGSSASIGIDGRDEIYSEEVVNLIRSLDSNVKFSDDTPWAIVCSFVNPHDIALYGEISKLDPLFDFKIDNSVPSIPKAPTANENLDTKPKAQSSYREVYPKALQPLIDTEVYPLVGRDLAPMTIMGKGFEIFNEPIYFMTDDDVTKGLDQNTVLGVPYESVVQPNHVETVIAKLKTGNNDEEEIWKYSRYFDNPQFWSSPGCEDETTIQKCPRPPVDGVQHCLCTKTIKTKPVSEEFEMYNLSTDPLETKNLAHSNFQTPETKIVQTVLANMLEEQCIQKRLYPSSGDVPGKPNCKFCSPDLIYK